MNNADHKDVRQMLGTVDIGQISSIKYDYFKYTWQFKHCHGRV